VNGSRSLKMHLNDVIIIRNADLRLSAVQNISSRTQTFQMILPFAAYFSSPCAATSIMFYRSFMGQILAN
jgi:hypothetical protein